MANKEKIDYKAQIKTFLADWVSVAKKKWWLYIVELAVVAIILVADLLSKKAAWEYLNTYGVKTLVPHLFNLVMVQNTGAGFGILQGKTVALTVVTIIVVAAIYVYLFFALKESEWLRISLVFVTAGGIGNIVDRIKYGYVRDFLQFAFWEDFPAFNVADSFVTVGAFMLVIVLIIMLVQEGKKSQKEFEEQQKNNVNVNEQLDPLDGPINLNPMMKSQNEFTFVVSENKDENTQENVQKATEKTQENSKKNVENAQENAQNKVEKTDENQQKNSDTNAENEDK